MSDYLRQTRTVVGLTVSYHYHYHYHYKYVQAKMIAERFYRSDHHIRVLPQGFRWI